MTLQLHSWDASVVVMLLLLLLSTTVLTPPRLLSELVTILLLLTLPTVLLMTLLTLVFKLPTLLLTALPTLLTTPPTLTPFTAELPPRKAGLDVADDDDIDDESDCDPNRITPFCVVGVGGVGNVAVGDDDNEVGDITDTDASADGDFASCAESDACRFKRRAELPNRNVGCSLLSISVADF